MSSAVHKKIARQIFTKWKAELATRNRGWTHVFNNFDDLIVEWHYAKIEKEDVEDLMIEAIRAHQPTARVAKMAFSTSEFKKFMDFDEFLKDWNEGISDKAWQAFYTYYTNSEAVSEPTPSAVTGGMDRKEYAKQRRYADSFESVDPSSVSHAMLDIEELERALSSMMPETKDDDRAGINPEDLENL